MTNATAEHHPARDHPVRRTSRRNRARRNMRLAAAVVWGPTFACAWTPSAEWTEARPERRMLGAYLGQPPPGLEPVVFAPGIVSTPEAVELNAVFSSNGREFLFARRIGDALKIFWSRQDHRGLWSTPRMVEFSRTNTEWDEVDMWFTKDERALLYISNAPVPGRAEGSVNIWRVARGQRAWGVPRVLPGPVNTDAQEIYPMVVKSGALYFSSNREGGLGGRDLYVAPPRFGSFGEPSNLGPAVNSPAHEGDVFVAPDESYLIVASNREGGLGKSDLYISFRGADDRWGRAVNLGAPINSEGSDDGPALTPDGRFFFFSRDGDIYWMDADGIEDPPPP